MTGTKLARTRSSWNAEIVTGTAGVMPMHASYFPRRVCVPWNARFSTSASSTAYESHMESAGRSVVEAKASRIRSNVGVAVGNENT
jgi:hypothetical protein